MIDTVRFQIPLPKDQLYLLSRQLRSLRLEDLADGTVEFERWNRNIEVGSFDHHINIYIPHLDDGIFVVEFSLPKVFLGDNIHLIDPDNLENKLSLLQLYIKEAFGVTLPDIKLWKLQRLDICYNFQFEDDEKAMEVLNIIKQLKVRRRKPNTYKDSVSWVTKNSNYKFYLKYPEYCKHDLKRIFDRDPERSFSLAQEAKGILRFEVTMRRRELERLRKVRIECFYSREEVVKMLSSKLENIIPLSTMNYMNDTKAYAKLLLLFGKRKANSLFTFYKSWFSTDDNLKMVAQKLNRTTIWRKWHDLEYAGLSIPINTKMVLKIDKNSPLLSPAVPDAISRGSSNTPRTLQDATKREKEVIKNEMHFDW